MFEAFEDLSIGHISRPAALSHERADDVITAQDFENAFQAISAWEGYEQSPLHQLSALSARCGVGALLYKDEAGRFGLGSFKALGAAYACQKLLADIVSQTHGTITVADIATGQHGHDLSGITVACATDGNHGRSLAWAAKRFGCRCVIFIHRDVSQGREEAISGHGAEIVRIDGNYDDSVRAAQETADREGWYIVSDTSYEGYMEVPGWVMAGYGVVALEILTQLNASNAGLPTHVFLQGGVGGFAAAIAACLRQQLGDKAPRVIVVEPKLADCLYQSARAGRLTEIMVEEETLMAGLSCGAPSVLAWRILDQEARDFMTLPEPAVAPTMRLLANPLNNDTHIIAGESAVAGLAGLLAAAVDPQLARALSLDDQSRVLVIGTEGATDAEIYAQLVGAEGADQRSTS